MERRGIVGRVDLLRALVALDQPGGGVPGLEALGALLGCEIEEIEAEPELVVAAAVEAVEGEGARAGKGSPAKVARPVPLWQPRELMWHDETRAAEAVVEERSEADADARAEAQRSEIPPPKASSLSPRRRVVPLLQHALAGELPGHEIDVDALVHRMGRGELVTEIPRSRRRGWPAVVIFLDRDWALAPFWADQEALCRWLLKLVGRSGVVVRIVDERGPEDRVLDLDRKPVSPWNGALAGVPVLALTDLGWYRGPGHQRAWLRFGRRLRRAGERIHALVPVPAARWTRPLSQVWSSIAWERPAADDGAASDAEERERRVKRLLTMAACAHRLEPGLLRSLRLGLPRDAADVGTEADAWLHEDMDGCSPSATVVQAERAQALREGLLAEDAIVVRDALQQWHWHRERQPELWHSEVLTLDRVAAATGVVDADQRARAVAFIERLGARARAAEEQGGEGLPEGLRGWLEYVERHAPKRLWEPGSRVGEGLQRAWWATHGDGEVPPPFADPTLRAELRDERGRATRSIELWQVGRQLGSGPVPEDVGSPVATLAAASERAYVVQAGGASREVAVGSSAWIEGRPQRSLELRTDRSTLRLGALEKPKWAREIGRDRFGLWAELAVAGVGYRMRWIAPGRFVMGSPEGEPGRGDHEGPQHEVSITRGYWLGETPVTQALWEAVTGENPSEFKSPDRPVEMVSWEDCHEQLIARLNESIAEDGGERFRLPTEAEWEHACRAGTTEATYAGPIEILGERNAPVLDGIAWYGGNSGVDFDLKTGADSSGWKEKQHAHVRAGTRRVGQKLPNQWGLHDMLGNVWEWCMDGWQRYGSESQQDPMVAADTGVLRVIRGGAWGGLAGDVRAAYRRARHPGGRRQSLGLRVARGQTRAGGPRPGPEDPAGSEGP